MMLPFVKFRISMSFWLASLMNFLPGRKIAEIAMSWFHFNIFAPKFNPSLK